MSIVSCPTRRQCEAVRLAGQHLRNREIAIQMQITERTVEKYLMMAYCKLDVWDRLEAAAKLQELDLQARRQRVCLHRSYFSGGFLG